MTGCIPTRVGVGGNFGPHSNNETDVISLWRILYDHGADLVLAGHEHNYQRYGPLNRDADGLDPVAGMRQFVVGTGGRSLSDADPARAGAAPGLEVWGDKAGDGDGHDASYGVLKLTLQPGSYEWEFLPIAGQSFADRGSEPDVHYRHA